jgi:predicted amidohydrolase
MTITADPGDGLTRIAVCQVRVDIGDPAGNAARADDAVREAVLGGAKVVILPELVGTGYVFADRAEALAVAEEPDGPTVQGYLAKSAEHDIVLVAGFCERARAEENSPGPYNSAMLADRGTLRAVYRKTHLWDAEKTVFLAGDDPAPVVDTSVGRIAIMVCYDLEFPEMTRDVSVRGAQLIAAPVNWPAGPTPVGERPIEVIKAQAAAAVNHVAVAVADRCGPERGVDWHGASLVCDVRGYPVAGPAGTDPCVLFADLDLASADDKRLGPRNDALADLRQLW